ncbi:hypothetical protein PMAYCL1PPCAC_20863, partial [Pristionchus mayeri]
MSEFTISFEVDSISELTEKGSFSPIVHHHDLPWFLRSLSWRQTRNNNVKHLAVYLYCNWESENRDWRVDYSAGFAIMNNGVQKKIKNVRLFSDVLDPANVSGPNVNELNFCFAIIKGFIDGDKIRIEYRVKLHKISGIRKKVVFDFSEPLIGMNNIALKIGKRTIHVSKDLLALHSPVFAATFFGPFEENSKNEVELQDIVYEEFLDLLNVVYSTSMEFSSSNVLHIFKLADRYQIEVSVLDRICGYFIMTKNFEIASKLKIADEFRLHRV